MNNCRLCKKPVEKPFCPTCYRRLLVMMELCRNLSEEAAILNMDLNNYMRKESIDT